MGMHGFYVLEVKTEALSSVQSMSSTPPKFIHLDITPPKKNKTTSIFSFLGDNTQISIKDMHALSPEQICVDRIRRDKSPAKLIGLNQLVEFKGQLSQHKWTKSDEEQMPEPGAQLLTICCSRISSCCGEPQG